MLRSPYNLTKLILFKMPTDKEIRRYRSGGYATLSNPKTDAVSLSIEHWESNIEHFACAVEPSETKKWWLRSTAAAPLPSL